jgi:hypothetical protein
MNSLSSDCKTVAGKTLRKDRRFFVLQSAAESFRENFPFSAENPAARLRFTDRPVDCYTPNGVIQAQSTPAAVGSWFELTPILRTVLRTPSGRCPRWHTTVLSTPRRHGSPLPELVISPVNAAPLEYALRKLTPILSADADEPVFRGVTTASVAYRLRGSSRRRGRQVSNSFRRDYGQV